MRKFLFSALACVAFAGSGFASNEVVSENAETKTVTTSVENDFDFKYKKTIILEERKPCGVYVYVKNSDGTHRWIAHETKDPVSWDDCGTFKDETVKQMKLEKFAIEQVTVTWG